MTHDVAREPVDVIAPSVADTDLAQSDGLDLRPPGDRYYRHPGDVVRLVSWTVAVALLAGFMSIGTNTAQGLTTDFQRTVSRVPLSVRELALALAQVASVATPVVVVVPLVVRRRWRRLGMVVVAAVAGAAVMELLTRVLDLSQTLVGAVAGTTWVASARFPPLAYVAGAAAVVMIGKPWLSRSWRRAADVALVVLALVMAVAGRSGTPGLLLALAAGASIGAALLVAFGAPNRRPAPAAIVASLREAGLAVTSVALQRAEGGRAQLYVGIGPEGGHTFVKVYGRDSRDADLLYRGYRALLLRGPNDDWPSLSLKHGVEHEAFLLLLARQAEVRCPQVEGLASLPDGSMALALEDIAGPRLDSLEAAEIDDEILDATWREVAMLHRARIAHRSLRAANVLVRAERPVLIDFGFAEESSTPRMQAIDRAELVASLALLVGPDRAVASARRVLGEADLGTAAPYLQPLALSAATRRQQSKAVLGGLRSAVTPATAEAVPLERLVRVRPRTLLTIAALTGAFYVLLPQLASVNDSFRALGSANWAWLLVSLVTSLATYVFAAIGLAGSIPGHLPLMPAVGVQVASSFVNRVTPANVAGMTLNVRFLRKSGVEPAEAVTGVGVNSLAGALMHMVLLALFFTWAGQGGGSAFKIPSGSKLLVAVAALFVLAGVVGATRRGRRLVRTHVVGNVKRSFSSIAALGRSPVKLAALFGGSVGLTMSYVAALVAAVAAFHGGVSFADVGAVYLGSSIIAAAAPTPGGLGALEATLVAGLTGVGMASGPAVAAVLSYRLATYWIPIVPGWLSIRALARRGYI